jgi:hypothetical protein
MFCGLCKQEERERLLRELETISARASEEKLKYQNELATFQKETEDLRQQLKKQTRDHQVSPNGFSPIEDRIFRFHCTFLKESYFAIHFD